MLVFLYSLLKKCRKCWHMLTAAVESAKLVKISG